MQGELQRGSLTFTLLVHHWLSLIGSSQATFFQLNSWRSRGIDFGVVFHALLFVHARTKQHTLVWRKRSSTRSEELNSLGRGRASGALHKPYQPQRLLRLFGWDRQCPHRGWCQRLERHAVFVVPGSRFSPRRNACRNFLKYATDASPSRVVFVD